MLLFVAFEKMLNLNLTISCVYHILFSVYLHLMFLKCVTVGYKSKTGSLFEFSKRKRKIGRL